MKFTLIAVLILISVALSGADTCKDKVATVKDAGAFSIWLRCRIDNVVTSESVNARDPGKQAESPAAANASTSLVDRSSGTDLIGTALNLAGLSTGLGSSGTTGTVTASWFALDSALTGHDPLDPTYYDQHSSQRRVFFTVGTDSSPTSGSGTANPVASAMVRSNATSSTSNSSAAAQTATPKIAGIQVLLINKRDLSTNAAAKESIRTALTTASMDFGSVSHAVEDLLLIRFDDPAKAGISNEETVNALNRIHDGIQAWVLKLTPADNKQIDAIIEQKFDAYARLAGSIRKSIQRIRQKPQLSILGQGKFGDANGNDTYRGEVAFDMGLVDRMNLTLNGSFDYLNSKLIGADTRGGRVAGDLQYQFTPDGIVGRKPMTIDLSAEGDWFQSSKTTYVGQVKLTIPLFQGVDLPISFTYASSTSLIKESNVEGKIGFTFDVSNLAKALMK